MAILALFYSVVTYLYRSQAIRTRKAIKYHDQFGPTALCVCLFVAVVVNMGFELKAREFV